MNDLYELLRGPGLRIAFLFFALGSIGRLAHLYGLSEERDRVLYNHADMHWGFRSIGHWLVPLGSRSMRNQPVFSIACYVFHLCLLAIPLFLLAHNNLWRESFGVSLWSMPDRLADGLTLLMMSIAVFLFVRRLARPEVRILSTLADYLLLTLTVLPFATGFLAYHQVGPYRLLLVLHILVSEILLVSIPFTKLGHFLLFFFMRAFIGFEMGTRRGARPW
jgi:nitrate reductase gamma subunit